MSSFVLDSDSDSESQEGLFYSVHEQKQRHKKKQLLENNALVGQSKVVVHLTIAQGLCDLFAPARVSIIYVKIAGFREISKEVTFMELLFLGFTGKRDTRTAWPVVPHF